MSSTVIAKHQNIDEILTELGNKSEIRNSSILSFPPIYKK